MIIVLCCNFCPPPIICRKENDNYILYLVHSGKMFSAPPPLPITRNDAI